MTLQNPHQAVVSAIPIGDEMLSEIGAGARNVWTAILNVGDDDEVRIGQTFVIFVLGPEIKDPSTGESLGHFEIVRGRGKVEHVQPKMCLLRSANTRSVPLRNQNALAVAAGIQRDEYKTEVAPFDSIYVGDLARRV